jgi:hypothetical protein
MSPGSYAYKFIVDGYDWCIDLASPTEVDIWGNQNNVVVVAGPDDDPPHESDSAEAGAGAVAPADTAASGPLSLGEHTGAGGSVGPPVLAKRPERKDPGPAAVLPTETDLLRLARFGARVLALYTKSVVRKKYSVRTN